MILCVFVFVYDWQNSFLFCVSRGCFLVRLFSHVIHRYIFADANKKKGQTGTSAREKSRIRPHAARQQRENSAPDYVILNADKQHDGAQKSLFRNVLVGDFEHLFGIGVIVCDPLRMLEQQISLVRDDNQTTILHYVACAADAPAAPNHLPKGVEEAFHHFATLYCPVVVQDKAEFLIEGFGRIDVDVAGEVDGFFGKIVRTEACPSRYR